MRDEQDEFVVEAEIVDDAEIVVDAEIVEGAEIENAISSAPDVRSKKPDQLSNPTSIQREPNRVPTSEEPTIILRVRRSSRKSESVPELIYRKNIHPGKVIENIGNFPPTATFIETGKKFDLGFGELDASFIYATSKAHKGKFDASLVDGSLPVASQVSAKCQPLPYWPNYFDLSPKQRRTYLDWLIGGRCDPNVELGYVFIYFYGLERRLLVDQKDFIIIAEEMIRLMPIYGASNSFRSYSARLMWLSLFFGSLRDEIPASVLRKAINATTRWTDELLSYLLAIFVERGRRVPPELAMVIARNDRRSTNSVIACRHKDQFAKLFEAKFKEKFPDGFRLKSSSRPRSIAYHPASGTLLRDSRWQEKMPTMPDAMKVTSQFKPLVEIWEHCIEDLRAYSRIHCKSDEKQTSEVYEALPLELRDGDHPEFDTWLVLWEKHANAEGWPLVPIHELAALKGIAPRARLTKTQSQRIVRTASAMGIGFVPDFEITNRNYAWEEKVCLFFEEPNARRDDKAYRPAAALLRLGMNIAAADGQIDQVEMDYINNHIGESFNLSDADSKRLECLTYLLSKCPDTDNSISKALCRNLSQTQRKLVGEFLVGIAAADQVLHPGEVKALKKAYRVLEIPVRELDDLLSRFATQESPTDQEPFHLDMNAIAQIIGETREVSRLLQEAMGDVELDSSSSNTEPMASVDLRDPEPLISTAEGQDDTLNSQFGDLPVRYHGFLNAVLKQSTWEAGQLESIAREHGQMLGGAVEAINEWSYEIFEDWLIEEGPEYHIHNEILNLQ